MKTIEVTREEGGDWIPFEGTERRGALGSRFHFPGPGGEVHAIKFDNGMIWDACNGFRYCKRPFRLIVRVPMGRRKLRKRPTKDGGFKFAP